MLIKIDGNAYIIIGRNFSNNANIQAYAGINDANIHKQSAGFDAKTRFVLSPNDRKQM